MMSLRFCTIQGALSVPSGTLLVSLLQTHLITSALFGALPSLFDMTTGCLHLSPLLHLSIRNGVWL